jgi:hypothetical protein
MSVFVLTFFIAQATAPAAEAASAPATSEVDASNAATQPAPQQLEAPPMTVARVPSGPADARLPPRAGRLEFDVGLKSQFVLNGSWRRFGSNVYAPQSTVAVAVTVSPIKTGAVNFKVCDR